MADKKEEGKILPAGAPLPSEEETGTVVEETPTTVKVGDKEYASPEALAEAYANLESKLGEQGNELGTERAAKNAALEELDGLRATQAEKAEKSPEGDNYETQLAGIYKQLNDGDLSVEEALQQSNALTAEMAATKAIQEATQSFENTLQDRDAKAIQDDFLKAHPDFAELRDTGKLAAIKQQSPMHDDFSAYFAFKEAVAFEKGKEEAAKLAAGDEGTKTVLTKAGESIQKENIPKTPLSDAETEDSMLKAMTSTSA